LDNFRALIAHGDTADKTNIKYMLLRKLLRSRFFYHFQRFIPSWIRWKLASLFSTASKELTIEDGNVLVDKMITFSRDRFREDYDAVVLGHCHEPVLRHYIMEGKPKTFAVLGDWLKHQSFLYYENGEFFMGYYKPGI
jgi:UDP-2,3-diacylglucosamine hydrolase